MKVIELIDKIYNRTKSGELSHHAKKLIAKHNLIIEEEIDLIRAVLIVSELSNKDKRISITNELMSAIDTCKEVIEPINFRESSYKQVCKFYHPDNVDTGSEQMFKFIQEIREFLWDYKGKPKKKIYEGDWDFERQYDSMSEEEKLRF